MESPIFVSSTSAARRRWPSRWWYRRNRGGAQARGSSGGRNRDHRPGRSRRSIRRSSGGGNKDAQLNYQRPGGSGRPTAEQPRRRRLPLAGGPTRQPSRSTSLVKGSDEISTAARGAGSGTHVQRNRGHPYYGGPVLQLAATVSLPSRHRSIIPSKQTPFGACARGTLSKVTCTRAPTLRTLVTTPLSVACPSCATPSIVAVAECPAGVDNRIQASSSAISSFKGVRLTSTPAWPASPASSIIPAVCGHPATGSHFVKVTSTGRLCAVACVGPDKSRPTAMSASPPRPLHATAATRD